MWNRQLIAVCIFSIIASALIFHVLGGLKEKFVNNNAEIIMMQPNSQVNASESIYLFADNKCAPECCLQGSAFSCSKGCVCLTEQQKLGLVRRGNNASHVPPDLSTDQVI